MRSLSPLSVTWTLGQQTSIWRIQTIAGWRFANAEAFWSLVISRKRATCGRALSKRYALHGLDTEPSNLTTFYQGSRGGFPSKPILATQLPGLLWKPQREPTRIMLRWSCPAGLQLQELLTL